MLGLKEIHVSKTGPKSEFSSDNTEDVNGLLLAGEQEDVKTITSGAASGDILGSFYNCGKFPVPTIQVVMIVPDKFH